MSEEKYTGMERYLAERLREVEAPDKGPEEFWSELLANWRDMERRRFLVVLPWEDSRAIDARVYSGADALLKAAEVEGRIPATELADLKVGDYFRGFASGDIVVVRLTDKRTRRGDV